MNIGKRVGRIVLAASLVVPLGNCVTTDIPITGNLAADNTEDESLIAEIISRRVMRVGLGIFVPWSFKDTKGNLVGFEVDVATKLAEDMGVAVEFVPTEWSGIIPALLEQRFDVIIGGMAIRPERTLEVDFTVPYNHFGMDCVVSRTLLPEVTCLEDLNNERVVIAVRLGTTSIEVANKFAPKAQLRQFDNDEAVIQAVLDGNAQAAFNTSPKPAYWAIDYSVILYRPLGGEYITHSPVGFAIRKGDDQSLQYFNVWISDHEGFLRERDHYWFHTKDWDYLLYE